MKNLMDELAKLDEAKKALEKELKDYLDDGELFSDAYYNAKDSETGFNC